MCSVVKNETLHGNQYLLHMLVEIDCKTNITLHIIELYKDPVIHYNTIVYIGYCYLGHLTI